MFACADSHEANAHDLDLAGMNPLVLDTLDAEVRADVEAARRIHFAQPRWVALHACRCTAIYMVDAKAGGE